MKNKKPLFVFIVVTVLLASVSIFGTHKNEEHNFIYDNINNDYIADINKEEYVADLLVKNTYIDEDLARKIDNKLENYFNLVHEEENLKDYYVTAVTNVPLYDLFDESEYVVGKLVTDDDSEILDIIFAENNDNGIVLENEYYDNNTGLVYIKKSDLIRVINDDLYADYVQAQTLRGINGSKTTSIDVSIDNKNLSVSREIMKPEITIPIDKEIDEAQVYINDYNIPLEEKDYSIEDGKLVINTSPANVSKINVKVEDGIADKVLNFFDEIIGHEKVFALSTYDSAITSEFGTLSGELSVGDYVTFSATGTNAWSAKGIDYVQTVAGSAPSHTSFYNSIISKNPEAVYKYVTGTYSGGYQNIYKSTYNACYGIKMNTASINDYNNESLKEWILGIDDEIQMGCIEVGTAAFRDMAHNDWLDYTAIVSAVGENYVAISFCSTQKTSTGASNQVMCGTYAVSYDPYPPKGAYFEDIVWSEYGVRDTFLSEDTLDMTVKQIAPPMHNEYKFIGYFLEDGNQVTDIKGNILKKDIDGLIENGVFINTSPIKLYAKFDDS